MSSLNIAIVTLRLQQGAQKKAKPKCGCCSSHLYQSISLLIVALFSIHTFISASSPCLHAFSSCIMASISRAMSKYMKCVSNACRASITHCRGPRTRRYPGFERFSRLVRLLMLPFASRLPASLSPGLDARSSSWFEELVCNRDHDACRKK